jgi:hypothetical protein
MGLLKHPWRRPEYQVTYDIQESGRWLITGASAIARREEIKVDGSPVDYHLCCTFETVFAGELLKLKAWKQDLRSGIEMFVLWMERGWRGDGE